MDNVNPNKKNAGKRTRVLRALDVIPPFDKIVPPLDDSATEVEPPQELSSAVGNDEGGGEGCLVGDAAAEVRLAEAVEVPAYDLAENILAEQRRVAGRRRRGPGRAETTPVSLPRPMGLGMPAPDFGSQNLLELQRIVAEIVARDIARLCRRPERPVPIGL